MLRQIIKNRKRMNKRGGIGIIIFFSVLLIILIIGFGLAMAWSVVDLVSDELTPIMEDLGMFGAVNMSEASQYSIGIVDTFVQALPWVIAFGYVMALVFTLVFVLIVDYSPHPAFMGFYFVLMILLIFGCVIMSNMYQDIYTGTDDIASRLQEQTIMSHLILHSPWIMGLIAAIGGIIMFTRQSSSEGGGTGGFGI